MPWNVHMMNARGGLTPIESRVRDTILAVQTQLEEKTAPLPLDIIVKTAAQPLPPFMCVAGGCFAPGLMELTIDMSKEAVPDALCDEIARTVCHEFHHALRWDGPGYGYSLGEALVSEGLAQVFVHEVLECPPEPWEIMPEGVDTRSLSRMAHDAFDDTDYSHDAWFFGAGDLPDGAGYALGRALVAAHLTTRRATALELACEPASAFRDTLLALAAGSFGPTDAVFRPGT